MISLMRFMISGGRRRRRSRTSGLICTTSTSSVVGGAEERKDHRIADIAAVPVGHAVDLDRAEQERQAGRRHHHVGRDLLAREDAHAAGLHIGRGNEELQIGARAHRLEIDEALDQVLERIDVERVEVVGRKIARQRVEPGLHRRAFERHEREQPVHHARAAAPAGCRRCSPRARNRRAACAPPRARRAPGRRPASTAFIAPAEVPEMPSMSSRSSSSRWSSTPQVKAPCAPPPCRARLMRLVVCAPRASAAAPGSSELRSFFIAHPQRRRCAAPCEASELGSQLDSRGVTIPARRRMTPDERHCAVQPPSIEIWRR